MSLEKNIIITSFFGQQVPNITTGCVLDTVAQIQLKSEVYIHLSQIHLNKGFSQLLAFNHSKKFPVLGQLGSLLYFKNVKCQNNSRENDLFQLLFLSSHSQWVRRLHTIN